MLDGWILICISAKLDGQTIFALLYYYSLICVLYLLYDETAHYRLTKEREREREMDK